MFIEKKEKEIDVEKIYVKPHKIVSREVTEKNLPIVKKDCELLHTLCFMRRGPIPSAYAIAHPQIRKKSLRFFVTKKGELIVNPEIIRHTKQIIKKMEGCLTFPLEPMVEVDRWHKCEVDYQTVEDDKLTEIRTKNLSGTEAEVWQHEIDHLDAIYIYDKKS